MCIYAYNNNVPKREILWCDVNVTIDTNRQAAFYTK